MPPRRVLVADDEKNIRLTLSSLLEGMGFEVETAVHGWDALIQVRKRHPDGPFWLILLDLKMPDMNGLEALHDIQRDAPGSHVVMVTAHGTVEDTVLAMRMGAEDVLAKPFTPTQVRAMIHGVEMREAEAQGTAPPPSA